MEHKDEQAPVASKCSVSLIFCAKAANGAPTRAAASRVSLRRMPPLSLPNDGVIRNNYIGAAARSLGRRACARTYTYVT